MSRVAEFLRDNYYARYRGKDRSIIPNGDQIEQAIKNHVEKFVIIEDEDIKGVAVFLTLDDETFGRLPGLDMRSVDVISRLIPQQGRNIHFILLGADGIRTIIRGVRKVISTMNPKTISWWSPDYQRLHVYRIRKE